MTVVSGAVWLVFIFFFQAEDGIRDRNVTGVQTCALPILQELLLEAAAAAGAEVRRGARVVEVRPGQPPRVQVETDGRSEEVEARSEERRVGKEGRVGRAAVSCR